MFRRGSRPVMLQNLIDMRKRLRGPPVGGDRISVVTTDVEGFSGAREGSMGMCGSDGEWKCGRRVGEGPSHWRRQDQGLPGCGCAVWGQKV